MSRWLKLLLTWMLALALPLQALAAGAMVHCGGHAGAGHHAPPGHAHGPQVTAAMPAEAAAHHAHAHAGGAPALTAERHAAPGLEGPGQPPADASAPAAAEPASGHDATSLHGKCSACAACCGVVALPSTAAAFGRVELDAAYAVASRPAPDGHVPAGDERPPRFL
jgi:hypothetical protein